MTKIFINDPKDLVDGLYKEIHKISDTISKALVESVQYKIKEDYQKRIQQSHYPLRNPNTKEILESIPPSQIAKNIEINIESNKAQIYIKPQTEADRSARMQELYGGKPWQQIRAKMQDLSYVNRVLTSNGLKGIKAKTR